MNETVKKTVVVKCPFCGAETVINVPVEGIKKYKDGALIQNAFPNMTAEEREVLISGICFECQKKVFGK